VRVERRRAAGQSLRGRSEGPALSDIGAIRLVTIGVSDLARSLALYQGVLGLTIEEDRPAPPELLAAWGVGGSARIVELSSAGYPVGRLRLVEYDPPATAHVRRDLPGEADSGTDIGPKAIDFYPAKPVDEAARELEAAGYPPRSNPIRHQEGGIESNELLFTGPDGEAFLIMEGDHGAMRRGGLEAPFSEIATVSVIAGDLEPSRRLYGEAFALHAEIDVEIPEEQRDIVADLTGVPPGTRCHFLVYMEHDEPSGKYLLVHFFDASTRRLTGRMQPGKLGISLYTHEVDDLARFLHAPELVVERGPAVVEGRRLVLARGPNEELFELVERA
jgi:catechol 2,3-dioxygenase-like lactoylglutathione lyase family enzyme